MRIALVGPVVNLWQLRDIYVFLVFKYLISRLSAW